MIAKLDHKTYRWREQIRKDLWAMLRTLNVKERDERLIYRAWDLKSQGNDGEKPSPLLPPGRDRKNARRDGLGGHGRIG